MPVAFRNREKKLQGKHLKFQKIISACILLCNLADRVFYVTASSGSPVDFASGYPTKLLTNATGLARNSGLSLGDGSIANELLYEVIEARAGFWINKCGLNKVGSWQLIARYGATGKAKRCRDHGLRANILCFS